MDLTGITASTPSLGGSSSALPSQELDKTAFMELLVAQLENQDPLDPASNEDFVAQLTSFSSLEQLENLNEGIVTMVLLQQSNALLGQLTEGSALIGQEVSWLDPTTGIGGQGTVDSVKVEEGLAYLNVDGSDIALIDITEVLGAEGTPDEDTADGSADDTTDADTTEE